MRGLNKVTLLGNLGKIFDIQALESGTKVAKLSLATTESYKNSKGQPHRNTEWHTVVVLWQNWVELAATYLQKGS